MRRITRFPRLWFRFFNFTLPASDFGGIRQRCVVDYSNANHGLRGRQDAPRVVALGISKVAHFPAIAPLHPLTGKLQVSVGRHRGNPNKIEADFQRVFFHQSVKHGSASIITPGGPALNKVTLQAPRKSATPPLEWPS